MLPLQGSCSQIIDKLTSLEDRHGVYHYIIYGI